MLGSDIVGAYSQVVRSGREGVMSRFILLGGILIAAWFVFMAVFPLFPCGAWQAFFLSCENLSLGWDSPGPGGRLSDSAPRELPADTCPDFRLETVRVVVIGVSALLIGFASWSFWKGTRD